MSDQNPFDSPNADEAFVQLLSRHEPVIRAFLRALLPSAGDVDAVMPEVALIAWRKFSELEEREAFPRWACVIARYEVLRYRRDKARERFVLSEAVLATLADEGADEFTRRERQMAALEDCLERLPAQRRSLVLWCYSPGASIKDIAARTGQSEDGLYQLLRRIRLELHRCVENAMRKEATT